MLPLATQSTRMGRTMIWLKNLNLDYFRPNRFKGFPGGSDSKESACNVRDSGSIPALGRSPGEGSGNPLQYSCLENSMDRGAWRATVQGVTKSRTRWATNTHTHVGTHTHTHSFNGRREQTGSGHMSENSFSLNLQMNRKTYPLSSPRSWVSPSPAKISRRAAGPPWGSLTPPPTAGEVSSHLPHRTSSQKQSPRDRLFLRRNILTSTRVF